MYSQVCRELNNYFEYDKVFGKFEIVDGQLTTQHLIDEKGVLRLQNGQYFRIAGSVFNDGVYQFPATGLHDEVFDGAIWLLAFPIDFVALVSDIEEWQKKNGGVDSAAMSPFTSESFGGYSYSKGGGSDASGKGQNTWQGAFKARLNAYRRIKGI
jgi:hypothetical protein